MADVEKVLVALKGNNLDKKVETLTNFEEELLNGTALEPQDINQLIPVLKEALRASQQQLSYKALTVISPLTTSIAENHHAYLKNVISQFTIIVIDKLGDNKDKTRDAALKVLLDMWSAVATAHTNAGNANNQTTLATSIKELAFGHKSWRVREQVLQWVVASYKINSEFSLKQWLPYMVKLLEDPHDQVRDGSKETLVLLFSSASQHAKSDLKRELKNKGIRQAIVDYILSKIAPQSADVPDDRSSVSYDSTTDPGTEEDYSSGGTHGEEPRPEVIRPPSVAENEVEPIYIESARELEREIQNMSGPFQGRETEQNWNTREKYINRLRSIIRGGAVTNYREQFVICLKVLMDGIISSLNSLRTTLSLASADLVKNLSNSLGSAIDPFAENFLASLIKMAGLTKKLVSQAGANVANTLLKNASYNIRLVNQIWAAMQDKNVQVRTYTIGFLNTLLTSHSNRKDAMDRTGGTVLIEKCLKASLTDANPKVREGSRAVFWIFYEIWFERGEGILKTVDPAVKKQMERDRPQGSGDAQSKRPQGATSPSRGRPRTVNTGGRRPRSVENGAPPQSETSRPVKEPPKVPARPVNNPPILRAKSPAPPSMSRTKGNITLTSPTRPPVAPTPSVKRNPTVSAKVAPRKSTILEQLQHSDSAVRVDGLITVANLIAKRSEGTNQELKRSPLPPDEDLSPILLKLLNDPAQRVIETLLDQEIIVHIIKVLPLEQLIPYILLLISEGGATDQSSMVLACFPDMKAAIGDEISLAALNKCLLLLSGAGTAPRKLGASFGFTPPQRRKIIHGILTWLNEIVYPKLTEADKNEGRITGYLGDPGNYKLLVNRLIPMMNNIKENSDNFKPLSAIIVNMHKLNPDNFEQVLFTFDSKIVDAVGNVVGWEEELEEAEADELAEQAVQEKLKVEEDQRLLEEQQRQEIQKYGEQLSQQQSQQFQSQQRSLSQLDNHQIDSQERNQYGLELQAEEKIQKQQQEEYELSEGNQDPMQLIENDLQESKEIQQQRDEEVQEQEWKQQSLLESESQKQREQEIMENHERELQAQREQAERERELQAERERELQAERERELQAERERELQAERERELQAQRERELQAQRDHEMKLQKEQREREIQQKREQQKQRERELQEKREREQREKRERELQEQQEREQQKQRERELAAQRERERKKALRERELQEQKEWELQQKREREEALQREREIQEQRERELQQKRERELKLKRERELQVQRERELQAQHERELQQQREAELQTQLELEEQRERELQMKRDRELRVQREHELQAQIERDLQLHIEIELQEQRERDLLLKREREREREQAQRELQQQREMQLQREREMQQQQLVQSQPQRQQSIPTKSLPIKSTQRQMSLPHLQTQKSVNNIHDWVEGQRTSQQSPRDAPMPTRDTDSWNQRDRSLSKDDDWNDRERRLSKDSDWDERRMSRDSDWIEKERRISKEVDWSERERLNNERGRRQAREYDHDQRGRDSMNEGGWNRKDNRTPYQENNWHERERLMSRENEWDERDRRLENEWDERDRRLPMRGAREGDWDRRPMSREWDDRGGRSRERDYDERSERSERSRPIPRDHRDNDWDERGVRQLSRDPRDNEWDERGSRSSPRDPREFEWDEKGSRSSPRDPREFEWDNRPSPRSRDQHEWEERGGRPLPRTQREYEYDERGRTILRDHRENDLDERNQRIPSAERDTREVGHNQNNKVSGREGEWSEKDKRISRENDWIEHREREKDESSDGGYSRSERDTISELDLGQQEKPPQVNVRPSVKRVVSLPPPPEDLGLTDIDRPEFANLKEMLDFEDDNTSEDISSGNLDSSVARPASILVNDDIWSQLATINGENMNPFFLNPEERFSGPGVPTGSPLTPIQEATEHNEHQTPTSQPPVLNQSNNADVAAPSNVTTSLQSAADDATSSTSKSNEDATPEGPDQGPQTTSVADESTPQDARSRALRRPDQFQAGSPIPGAAQDRRLLLATLLARLNANTDVDSHMFRKLISLSKETPLSEGTVSADIWEDGDRFAELMTALFAFLDDSHQQNSELKENALQLLQQLLINQSDYAKGLERDILRVLLESRGDPSSNVCGQADDSLETYVQIVDSQVGLYALIDIMESNLSSGGFGYPPSPSSPSQPGTRSNPKGSAFVVLAKLVKRFDKKSLERQIGRVVPLAIRGFNDPKPEIRKSVVDALVSIYAVIGDDTTIFQYLGSLSPAQQNLLHYYFDKSKKYRTSTSAQGVQVG